MKRTLTGRVVYQRPEHLLVWPDVARIVDRMRDWQPAAIDSGFRGTLTNQQAWEILAFAVTAGRIETDLQVLGGYGQIGIALSNYQLELRARIQRLRTANLIVAYSDALDKTIGLSTMDTTQDLIDVAKTFLPGFLGDLLQAGFDALGGSAQGENITTNGG